MLAVLNLRVRQRSRLRHRPQNRTRRPIQSAVADELAEFAHNLSLGGARHREIRVVPVADDAVTPEALALNVNPLLREGAAETAKLNRRNVLLGTAGGSDLLLNLPLDRQTVAVPAGNIIRVGAQSLARAVDDVLENLVQRRADMQLAVRIRRAVMQNILRASARLLALKSEEINLVPESEDLRLLLRKSAAHRKISARQKNRLAPPVGGFFGAVFVALRGGGRRG